MTMEISWEQVSFVDIFHAKIKVFGLDSKKESALKFVLKQPTGLVVSFLMRKLRWIIWFQKSPEAHH